MVEKRAVQIGATVWAMVAAALTEVDTGALMVVGVALVVLPLSALLAAVAAAHDRVRVAA